MTHADPSASLPQRVAILLYGILCYVVGVAGLGAIIAALAKQVPFGFLASSSVIDHPVAWNGMLVVFWGVVHTSMARDAFKSMLTRVIPEPAERATYVLVAGVTSLLLVGAWEPIAGVVWSVSNDGAAILLWGLFAFGWIYLLAATFAIDHFDLFGLRQVYFHFRRQPRTPLPFVKRAMYRFSRHPIQTGVLISIWATPEMTMTQLPLSVGFTLYIFVGLWFEERDLVADIGPPYEAYRLEAGRFLPRIRSAGRGS
ncbi:MAG: isoprenylcysteine carboxylmethyltransferase family protein [Myxococcota bacterium]